MLTAARTLHERNPAVSKLEVSIECKGLKNKDILSKSDPCVPFGVVSSRCSMFGECERVSEKFAHTGVFW